MRKLALFSFSIAIGIVSCTQYEEAPREPFDPTIPNINPFDDWTAMDSSNVSDDLDSTSFLGIYSRILNPKCNNPACHDGTFEPDFRTPLSAYHTTIYSPPLKNTENEDYDFRVVPFDTEASWLHHRITTDDQVLGRMPLYDTLAQWQIDAITTWINEGAKDIAGNIPEFADLQPFTAGYAAFLNDTTGVRLEDTRGEINEPFIVPQNSDINIWFALFEEEGGDLPYEFTNTTMKLSYNPFDFTDAGVIPLESVMNPLIADNVFAPNIPFFLYADFNTSGFNPGDVIYIRVTAKDSDHSSPTEIPEDGGSLFLMQHFSFKIAE